ncbi:MAG: potassium-transporting ATPase subunit KdpA, partial [Micrococcales bacterium]|nr:potassium-transporting ATPase subunit KdpA [Micrococcales bacterium]
MEWLAAIAAFATVAVPIGLLYRPFGDYIAWVFTSPDDWLAERGLYRLIGVDPKREQSWPAYLRAVLVFSAVGFFLLYLLERLQPFLPYSLGLGPMSPDLSFNTAASFIGNTNWQSYVPEQTVGYSVQMAGLTVQSFVSAAAGLGVAIALVRGIAYHRGGTVGNFWVDVVRGVLRLLLPLCVLAAIVLLAGGAIQNFTGFTQITTVDGATQVLPGGPVASQEAIKMLGTNGGGFFNANSAHPFENPTGWTNLFQVFLLIVIPFALPRTFGTMVKDQRMGYVILATMVVLFVGAYVAVTACELSSSGTALQAAGGAMEGKEQRFGVVGSTLFATATTGTTGGAANSMHGSYTALGGLVLMLNMALGEISPGGVGAGLYTILVLAIIAVFLTGLLLGRAPVFLGKRIGTREVIVCSLFILVVPVLALGGMAISLAVPAVHQEVVASMGNTGPHGLSEVMYAFISCAINNGSSFAGFNADTPYLNTTLGIVMLLGRFLPVALILALAGSFAAQERASSAAAELPIYKAPFVGLLVFLIIFISLPTFFPILAVGPL